MSESLIPPNHLRLLGAARVEALAFPDPWMRFRMLDALIQEGDTVMVEHAFGAINACPENSTDGQEQVDVRRTGYEYLIQTLANQRLFSDADVALRHLLQKDRYNAIESAAYLLGKGYAGPEEVYLHFGHDEALKTSPGLTGIYLQGLATYGIDLLAKDTTYGTIFDQTLVRAPDEARRGYIRSVMAFSYARGGHFVQALKMKQQVTHPYYQSIANLDIAVAAGAKDNQDLVHSLLSEVPPMLEAIKNCNKNCGRPYCDPSIDAKEVELKMAFLYARLGDTERARRLAGDLDPRANIEYAMTMATLYKASGYAPDREAALEALRYYPLSYGPDTVGNIVRDIGLGDLGMGINIPSLQAGNESSPPIAWELFDLYDVPSISTEDGQEAHAKKARVLLRDASIGAIVKLLAETGAPHTAEYLMRRITHPVEKIRAMAGMARILRDGR